MRSIWLRPIASVLVFIVSPILAAQNAPNQINPGNQIKWPQPSCAITTGAYNPAQNVCTDLSQQPPSNILWPQPSCALTTGAYNPAQNVCIDLSKQAPSNIVWPAPSCGQAGYVYSPKDNLCFNFNNAAAIPPANVNWPNPTCSNPGYVFSPKDNLCYNFHNAAAIPPANMNWPATCTPGLVYSPSQNVCVAQGGSANNPALPLNSIQMNGGTNFAPANYYNIGAGMYDMANWASNTGNANLAITNQTLPYWPMPTGSTPGWGAIAGDIIIGWDAGANLGNYNAIIVNTTATAPQGATTLTLAQVTDVNGVAFPINRFILGAGIPAGAYIVSTNVANSTVNITQATTAALSNTPVTIGVGQTNDAILIGRRAGQNAAALNGAVAIGASAEAAYVGQGAGGEEGNFVAIGPYAMANSQTNFEAVAIGNKACMYGNGFSGTVCIGNHIGAPTGNLNNSNLGGGIYIGSSIGWQMAQEQAFVTNTGSTLVGGAIWNDPNMNVSPGTYNVTNETILGSGAGKCMFNTNYNTIVGASVGTGGNGCNVAGTVPTAHNNIMIGDGGTQQPGSNISTGTYNTLIGNAPYGGGNIGAPGFSLTTGSYNVGIGFGAMGSITTSNSATVVGPGAANLATVAVDAFGNNAAVNMTTGTANVAIGTRACADLTTGTNNTCLGYFSAGNNPSGGPATGTNNVFIGYQTAMQEAANASYDTYVGAQTGYRTAPGSLSYNTAFGFHEFGGSGSTGTEQYNAFLGDSSNCNGCTYVVSLGHTANLGAVAHSVQIDAGTNNTGGTFQWGTLNFLDTAGNLSVKTTSVLTVPTIASAATIAPTSSLIKVSGTVAISTITPPTILQNGGAYKGCIKIIPTGAFTTVTGGNIALASTAIVNRVMDECYDGTSWFPSY